MNINTDKIGFIGFGLIGGSIAKALKKVNPQYIITVYSRSSAPLETAKQDGIVDIICTGIDDNFKDCSFIFLCTPVKTVRDYLKNLKGIVNSDCIITDVGSVKSHIHHIIEEFEMEDLFIGGHPMAGSELTGYINSDEQILNNAIYVLTPTKKTSNLKLQRYLALVNEIKAQPIRMDYATHDLCVAAISHLPHLAAAALTKVVKDNDTDNCLMKQLASSGFRDTTRLASSSPEMWEQICSTNNNQIVLFLNKYIEVLTQIKLNIENKKENYIFDLFKETGEYKNSL